MTVQFVKRTRNVQKSVPGRQSQPSLRRGQVVLGTVQRHLSSGLIQAKILNYPFVASTKLPVSVGDKLLMHVVEAEPKPHLQVLSSPSAGTSQNFEFSELDSIGKLLEKGFPLSLKSLQDGLFAGGLSSREFAKLVSKAPHFWQRVFWNLSPASQSDVTRILHWSQEGQNLFHFSALRNLTGRYLQQNFQYSSLQNDLNIQSLRIFNPINDGSGTFGNLLNAHTANVHFMNSLIWEYGTWSGLFFPFTLDEQAGLAALSYWQPETGDGNVPKRLSMIAGFGNGWILHLLFDYRQSDIAGMIEVNNRECEQAVKELLPGFIQEFYKNGYNHAGISANYVPDLNIEYSQLLPPVKQLRTFTG